jgi:FkbM family methyltransferase
MKSSVIYSSSVSHENLWEPISISRTYFENFIFSTAQNDTNPTVIVELQLPFQPDGHHSTSGDSVVGLQIFNRKMCGERCSEMEIFSSADMRNWRKHSIVLSNEFLLSQSPLKIEINCLERFLMFQKRNSTDHFHIGGIHLDRDSDFGRSFYYEHGFYEFIKMFGHLSNSQVMQDIFALYNCGFSNNYFLEFGVNDWINLSNTLLLEHFGWHGMAGEALKDFASLAKLNRNCTIVEGALSKVAGETLEFWHKGLISSSTSYASIDSFKEERESGEKVIVKTNRLDDLMRQYKCPKNISFFSLDVEGAELEVLETFPFDEYTLTCAAIEHNYTKSQSDIDQFMREHDFSRVLTEFSGHDAFYLSNTAHRLDWRHLQMLSRGNPHCEKLIQHANKLQHSLQH